MRKHIHTLFCALLILDSGTMMPGADAQEPEQLAIVQDRQIDESSGLAISGANPGMLWVHNDSGDKPRLFLVDREGQTRCILKVTGAEAVDWEDMCSFRSAGQSWLLIGDVGDNDRKRTLANKPARLY